VTYTDSELLALAKEYDQNALAMIYDQYSTALYKYAYRQTGSQQLAEDCVAETFSRFLNAMQQKRGPRNYLRPYLYRIAHNWIIDQFRSQKPADGLDEHAEFIESKQVGVEARIIGEETAVQLRQYIKRLNSDQHQVIALKHLEGMSNQEVAEIMGRSVGSVKALNSRALENLRKFMRQDGLEV